MTTTQSNIAVKLNLLLKEETVARAKALAAEKGMTIDDLFVYLLTKEIKLEQNEEASTTNMKE